MPRVTLVVPRLTLIAAVGFIALLLPAQAFAATVTLTCVDGSPTCDYGTLRATLAGNYMNAQVKKLQWKKGSDAWKQWDYIAGTGDSGCPVAGWPTGGATRDGTWPTWQGPNVTWQFILTVHFMIGMSPPQYADVDSGTLSVAVVNTVVTSGTDVIFHHVNDSHEIDWHIDHKAVTGLQFSVTVTITSMSGGTVRTYQTTQSGAGNGAWTWDGKNQGGQDVAGIYAYKVYASQGPPMCNDQDKSPHLTATLNSNKFHWVSKNTQAGTLKVIARYTLADTNGAASNCCIRFYGPDLSSTPLATLDNQDGTSGTHWSAQVDIAALDGQGNIVSPLYCVVSAAEGTASAALNRGADTKVALQSGGTTLEQIGIITPSDGAKFAYNGSTPGVCTVPVQGAPADGGLQWTLDGISGSTLNSYPANAQGEYVSFTYTTLPSSNASFGAKALGLTCQTPALTQSETIRIYFATEGTNHPDSGYGILPGTNTACAPNWYYYWSQTSAEWGEHYFEDCDGSGLTRFYMGQWRAFIHKWGYTSAQFGGWNGANGIDFFANTCRHEGTHRLDAIAWWGANSDRDPTRDLDNDFIPDDLEATLLPGHPYLNPIDNQNDPNNQHTYLDDFGYGPTGGRLIDCEDYCLRTEPSWTNGSADGADWSAPGHQYQ